MNQIRRLPIFMIAVLLLAGSCPNLFRSSRADSQLPPEDFGLSGLQQELRKLQTTGRLMHTDAHPDDEDGGMLALESHGLGAEVMLFTLNRGEGGQNKTGKELFDSLGILRTLELLKADEYYGVHERFSRVVDFGFSKTADETFEKWHGHDIPLEDMVRVIRTFRPDVLVARFQGAPRDGHGHHQASGILTREAFKVAGDPKMFPNQIAEGLVPWQPKKLYMDNVRPNEDYTLKLDTGAYDPALGMSYIQFALEGLSHQLSQGSGGVRVPPGHRYSYYKLLESTVPTPGASGGHETSFFDGIDTSLAALNARLGSEAIKLPHLAPDLETMAQLVAQAGAAFTPDNPARSATPLLAGFKLSRELIDEVKSSDISAAAKAGLLVDLEAKRDQFERAANLALGIAMDVTVDVPPRTRDESQPVEFPGPQSTFAMAVPGQTFSITAHFYNRSPRPVTLTDIYLDVPKGWKLASSKTDLKEVGQNDEASEQFQVTVPPDAPYTRPYWHRDDPQTDTIYKIDDPRYVTLPFPPFPVHALASYTLAGMLGEISSVAQVKYIDPLYGQGERPLVVGPALSVEVEPPDYVVPAGRGQPYTLSVGVRSNA
ncbi:MAG TPA: PIG-L family deacetylase, partial [Blastocatellia bacterium]